MALKRFYKIVAVRSKEDGYTVALDERPLRSPAKAALFLPTGPLAETIAGEWRAQEEVVRPETMPMMQLASTAVDRVRPARARVVDEIAAYARSDLLCYRAEAPAGLVARQAAHWQSLLDWAALRFDAPLVATTGVVPIEQPAAALAVLKNAVAKQDDFGIAALHALTTVSGSLIIALAVHAEEIDAEAACAASQLDEDWQAEQWGRDTEAAARRARICAEIHTAARFCALLRR